VPSTALARPPADEVLARATLRCADALGLPRAALARILGTSAATISRLSRGRGLDPASKEGELALLLVRAYRSLQAVVGGRDEAAARWFAANNRALGGVPRDLVERAEGLVHVVGYLDAMRGRI
jgi:hypothetical protein